MVLMNLSLMFLEMKNKLLINKKTMFLLLICILKFFKSSNTLLDYSQLAKLAHDIINAESIIIIGYHKSALPSKMLQFNLFKIHKKAMYISQDEIHELPNIIQENDILIAFSNDGNGLEAIKNEIKSEKQEKQFNLSIITMNDKLSLKKLSDNYGMASFIN